MLSNSIESFSSSKAIFGERLLPSPAIKAADPVPLRSPRRIRGGLAPRKLQRVRDYVHSHLDETINLEALAGIASLSKCHFARAFKQSVGVTPHEYIVQSRVRRAVELIAGTDLALSQIALESGFSDQSHLARRFREHVGTTPSSYRWSLR